MIYRSWQKVIVSLQYKKLIQKIQEIKQGMKCQKPQTLRDYLDSYQQLRKCKSNENLLGSKQTNNNFKSTYQLEQQIDQKLKNIRKSLKQKHLQSFGLSAMECLHQLEKILKQVLLKLKRLEGYQGNINSPNLAVSKIVGHQSRLGLLRKASSKNYERLSKKQSGKETERKVNVNLICPEQLQKKIKMSDNLSILGISRTTEPVSPRQIPSYQSINSIQSKQSAQEYFTHKIKQTTSINPQQGYKQEQNKSGKQEYNIRISCYKQTNNI